MSRLLQSLQQQLFGRYAFDHMGHDLIYVQKYNTEHFLGTDEDELARQLTLVEFDNFQAIAV